MKRGEPARTPWLPASGTPDDRAFPRLGAMGVGTDAASATLQDPDMRGGQRHGVPDERSALLSRVPRLPVLPVRSRVLAAGHRTRPADGGGDAASGCRVQVVRVRLERRRRLCPARASPVIAGVGVSMALPATPTALLSAVAPPDMGKASGVNNTLQRFGGAFGVAMVSAVFAANGHLGSPAAVTAGFRPALA